MSLAGREGAEADERTVWDFPVRVCHWTLGLAIAGSYFTHVLGITRFKYHAWCGYVVLVLVCFRIVWGVVGTRHALFRNFVCGPGAVLRYVQGLRRGEMRTFPGHNPLGGWMSVVLLLMLLAQALLGLFGNDQIYNSGPLSGYVSGVLSDELTSLHRQLFWWISGAVIAHVGAVVFHRIRHGERLVKAMLTGRKPAAQVSIAEEISSSHSVRAAIILATLATLLAVIVEEAAETAP
jgi:cytochrome b